jgi:hypothetical protein
MKQVLGYLLFTFFAITFLHVTSYSQTDVTQTASVNTDKPDYAPLSNAVFTGSGFAPNEDVISNPIEQLYNLQSTIDGNNYF